MDLTSLIVMLKLLKDILKEKNQSYQVIILLALRGLIRRS